MGQLPYEQRLMWFHILIGLFVSAWILLALLFFVNVLFDRFVAPRLRGSTMSPNPTPLPPAPVGGLISIPDPPQPPAIWSFQSIVSTYGPWVFRMVELTVAGALAVLFHRLFPAAG